MENQANFVPNQQGNQQVNVSTLPKYGIFQSLQHVMGAVKRNPVTFGVTLLVSYVLSGIALVLTVLAATSLLLGQFGLLFASFGNILTVLIASLIIYTLLYALVYAFTVSCIAYSLSDEKYGIGTTLKKALKSTVRVVKVNAWVVIVAYWPIVIAAFLPLLLVSGGDSRGGNASLALLTPVLIIAALIWALIAQLRYALAPYVALFEPEVPVMQTLKRSEQLLKKGGQWFVFKGVLIILAIFIFLAVVTGSNLRQLENSNDNIINVIFIILSILIEGAMVMLYLNRSRKQAASNTPQSLRLMVLVLAILVALFGFVAYKGKNSVGDNAFSKSQFSQADQEEFMKISNDVKRKIYMKALGQTLEIYYTKNGFYPGENEVANSEWVAANLTGIETKVLIDPQGSRINSTVSDYQYQASPESCTKCASFELSAKLEKSDKYTQSSLNNSIQPGTSTTPTPTTSSSPATQ